MSLEKLFTATLGGIIIGILIAPGKGRDTRHKLAGSIDTIKSKVAGVRGTTTHEMEELQRVFGQEITGLRQDLREKVLRILEASKSGFNQVKSEALS